MKQVGASEGEHLVILDHFAPQVIEQNIRVVLPPKLVVGGGGHLECGADPAVLDEQRIGLHELDGKVLQQLFWDFTNGNDFDDQAGTNLISRPSIFAFTFAAKYAFKRGQIRKEMRFNLRRFLIMLALAALACSPALVSSSVDAPAGRAYGHVENIVRIGSRLAGTQAEAIAASYIENEFRSYGLEVWVENFVVANTYALEENRLSVLQPRQENLTCIPVVYSMSGTVRGQLACVRGEPWDEELLRGCVVLVERSELTRKLVDLPPLAIITYLENAPAKSEIWFKPPGAPMVGISSSDAHRLIGLLAAGRVEVELRLVASAPPSTSQNVVARLPGESDETILVTAHHDSVLTPGAVDDASGVAVVLEVARGLSTTRLQRTIMFASFGGEEFGLLGSADFVSRHKAEKIVAVVIFDCIGTGPDDGLRVGMEGPPPYATTGWLDAYVRMVAENLGFQTRAEHVGEVHGYSDHVSFTNADLPATWVYWVNPTGYDVIGPIHTLADDMGAVDALRLQQAITLGTELVRRLAVEDLEAWRWRYALPMRVAIFTVTVLGVAAVSIGSSCFARYRRGWTWCRAAFVAVGAVGASALIAGALLLF